MAGYVSPLEDDATAATPTPGKYVPPTVDDDAVPRAQTTPPPEEDDLSRYMDIGLKALMGTIAGSAAPVGYNIGRTLALKAFDVAGMTEPEQTAVRKIAAALASDKITPAEARRNLANAAPKTLSLLDAAGQNIVTLGRDVVGRTGPARELAHKVLTERALDQPQRIVGDLRGLVSPSMDFYATAADLIEKRREESAPLYKAAEEAGAYPTDRILKLLETPTGKKAAARAMQVAADEGVDLSKTFLTDPAFGKVVSPQENMRVLHYLKTGLDRIKEEAMRENVFGDPQHTSESRAITKNIINPLIEELDDINPDYRKARQVYSSYSDSMEALAKGRSFITEDAEVTARDLSKMSDTDKALFRAGAVRGLKDMIYNTPDGASAVSRVFGSPGKREKMLQIFEDPRLYDEFESRMKTEAKMHKNRQTVLGGSQTADKLADAAFNQLDASFLSRLVSGDIMGAGRQALVSAMTRSRGMTPAVREEIGKRIFDPVEGGKALREIEDQGRRAAKRAIRLKRTGVAGAILGGAGAAAAAMFPGEDEEQKGPTNP